MKWLIILILMPVTFSGSAQKRSSADSVEIFLDSAFSIISTGSLYKNSIDFESKKMEFIKHARKGELFISILKRFGSMFDEMGDNHSSMIYDNREYASKLKGMDESKLRKPILEQVIEGKVDLKAEMLNKEIAYIRIPPNGTSEKFEAISKASQVIQNELCSLMKQSPRGIIIDLRLNWGGNMYPMILGIHQLIGQGTFAKVIKEHGVNEWRISGTSIYEDENRIGTLPESCDFQNKEIPIAILISQVTGSSGEITGLAFMEKSNVKFFGEKSAGYMTSNELYYLPFDTYLLLAEGYETTRNGEVVKYLVPDMEMINGDDFEQLDKDLKVAAAIDWIVNYSK